MNAIQDELFKAIAVLGGEDIRGLARREIAELMERVGALPSAAAFRTLVAITHVYPDHPDRQARAMNEAYAAAPDLLSARAAVRQYLERRLPPLAAQ